MNCKTTKFASACARTRVLPAQFRCLGKFALAAGIFTLASASISAQQPDAYPANSQYAPQSNGPAQQYPSQPQYPQQPYDQQQNSAPSYQQPQYAPQPDANSANAYDPMGAPDAQPTPTQQPLSADQLEQLLAPVALYPDALLAQVLAASTYPAQITVAEQWLQQMRAQGYNDPNQIVAGADAQTGWDPSVKALTAVPQVLDMLSQNLAWTTSLGNAYYNQPQDVMQTVQVLRERAQQAGTLQSSPQEEVSEDNGNIDLAPATPEVVYVPAYNPWAVYGAPIAPYPGFGFSFLGMLGGFGAHFGYGGLQFGMGIAMAAFEHTPWGWMGWGLDWLAHSVLFNHSDYWTHSTTVADWGFPRGGPRARGPGSHWNGGPGFSHPEPYNRAGTYENGRGPAYPRMGNGFAPGNRFPDGGANGWNRGSPQPAWGMTHPANPAQQAYNRTPFTAPARPQSYAPRAQTYTSRPPIDSRSYPGAEMYGRSQNAYNYANRPAQSFAERPGTAYASPYRAPASQVPAYRTPQYDSSRAYSSRPSESYGNAYARNQQSGAFHMFGSGHESRGYNYRVPKNFGGGHESHSFGHEKAPKMPHGGHSGGGHHHF